MDENFFYAALLSASPHVKSSTIEALKNFYGSAEKVWHEKSFDVDFLTDAERQSLLTLQKEKPSLPKKIFQDCRAHEIKICHINSNEYPSSLKEISHAPLILFYRGDLQAFVPRIALVGSRKITPYGKTVAENFAQELANCGLTIVSGAARGIDTASHQGALKSATGRTVAVLACGLDIAYPPENKNLLDEIAERGAVISEFPPKTPPRASFFPARNRIISGLSLGTLVIEAGEKSGALITARFALEQNREVFAIPAGIFSPMSLGCNRLIQNSEAKLVLTVEDILSELNLSSSFAFSIKQQTSEPVTKEKIKEKISSKTKKQNKPAPQISLPALTEDEEKIFSVLSLDTSLTFDEILYALNDERFDVSSVSSILFSLEMNDLIIHDEHETYRRKI